MRKQKTERPMCKLERRAIAGSQNWVNYLEKWCSKDTDRINEAKKAVEDQEKRF